MANFRLIMLYYITGKSSCDVPKSPVVKEVSAFRHLDQFQGLVLTYADSLSKSVSPPLFEVLLKPMSHHKRFVSEGDIAKRLLSLEVSSFSLVIAFRAVEFEVCMYVSLKGKGYAVEPLLKATPDAKTSL